MLQINFCKTLLLCMDHVVSVEYFNCCPLTSAEYYKKQGNPVILTQQFVSI